MNEIKLQIRVYPSASLRKRAKPILQITSQHRDILSAMAQLMYAQQGIGLAASQVGIDEAMIVVDAGKCLYKLVNPRIIKKEGSQALEEGCLSLPGICLKVKRAKKILVEAKDEDGNDLVLEAKDLLACVFQHEVDHLKGKLILDYASFWDKLKIRRKMRRLVKGPKGNEKLSESERESKPM